MLTSRLKPNIIDGALSHVMIGMRKQSVSDVEQIFNHIVLNFMEKTNYEVKACYRCAMKGG